MSRLGKRAVALVSSKWPLSIAASMQPLVENPPRECASFAGFQSKLQMRGKCCLETLAASILAKAFLRDLDLRVFLLGRRQVPIRRPSLWNKQTIFPRGAADWLRRDGRVGTGGQRNAFSGSEIGVRYMSG